MACGNSQTKNLGLFFVVVPPIPVSFPPFTAAPYRTMISPEHYFCVLLCLFYFVLINGI